MSSSDPAAAVPAAASASASPSLAGLHILVTGGAGYIGSHTVLALLQTGSRVTVVDNLINSSRIALDRVSQIAGRSPAFHHVDLRDYAALANVFSTAGPFDACIHFAGLKAVGESVNIPLLYYEHNVVGTLNLLRLCEANNCRNFVFSSSATVYGLPKSNPIPETAALSTTNPYGQTKLVIEEMLRDVSRAPSKSEKEAWRIVILRYFNPIGAHESGLIGEDPLGIPNNLLPFVMQVAVGRREKVNVFGKDYDTPDGTGVRDYIHVQDLARGHLAALAEGVYGSALEGKSCDVFNLGTGHGVSVLEMINAAEKASKKKIAFELTNRRPGDIGTCYADVTKSHRLLKFKTEFDLLRGVEDSWRWQSQNPDGFAGAKKAEA